MTTSPVFNNGTFTTTMENSTSFSFSPGDLTFESADMGGEGRILMDANYALNQVYYTYQYYLKDHLGSTRMVIGNNQALTEAVMYQPYGTMSDPLNISTPDIAAREKFTGKEYDQEGLVAGVTDGLRLDYFGRRYYDPEIGVWTAADPKGQYFCGYAYAGNGTNPIIFVDENGEWIGLVIGAAVGFVAGGTYQYWTGQSNPQWSWGGAAIGTVAGAVIGHIAEKLIVSGMEHAHPTGNTYLDDKSLRLQMKSGLKDFVAQGDKAQEWGGAIDKTGNGKYSLRLGESVAPSSGAKASIGMPSPSASTEATVHTQFGVSFGDNYKDLAFNFPNYDAAATNAGASQQLNNIILSQDKILSFTGDYTMRAGTYASYSTDYVFKSFGDRLMTNLFTW
jgi:RHS repeat-associated protein